KTFAEEMVAADEADAARIVEAAARGFVGDELDSAQKSDRANLADERMVLEFRKQLRQCWPPELFDARDKLLLLRDFDILQRDGASHGVTREGIAVIEVVGVRHQRIDDLVVDNDAGERDIARRHRLGEGDEVGADAVVLRGEPRAEAAEARDHLVGKEKNPILVDDALHLGPVAFGSNLDAARALYRLAGERSNVLGADGQDFVL